MTAPGTLDPHISIAGFQVIQVIRVRGFGEAERRICNERQDRYLGRINSRSC
jgi:hypothetical protein